MSTGGSSLCLSRHQSQSYDDCDLPKLQYACAEPVVREICYTEDYTQYVFTEIQHAGGDVPFVFIFNILQ
jgi:hypothetical protein